MLINHVLKIGQTDLSIIYLQGACFPHNICYVSVLASLYHNLMYKAEKIKGIFYLDISKVWSSHIENYVSLLTQILLLYLDTLTANSDINVCFYYFNCRSKDKELKLIDKF